MGDHKEVRKTAVRSVLFNFAGRLLSFAVTFFLTPIIMWNLGRDLYGVWSLIMGLTGYYAIADLGLRGTGTKFIAEYYGKKDIDAISRVVTTTLVLYASVAVLIGLAALIMAPVFTALIDVPQGAIASVRVAVLLTGIGFGIRLISQPFAAVMAGLTRFDLITSIGMAGKFILAGGTVAVIKAGYGLAAMSGVFLFVAIMQLGAQYVAARKLLPQMAIRRSSFAYKEVRKLGSFALSLATIGGVSRLGRTSILLLIGGILGTGAVAVFSVAETLVRKGVTVFRSVTKVVTPLASRFQSEESSAALTSLTIHSVRLVQTMAFVLLGGILVEGYLFIELWLGASFAEDVFPVLRMLAIAMALKFVSGGASSLLIGIGKLRSLRRIVIGELAICLACGIPLTYFFGVVGFAWALVVSNALAYTIGVPIIVTRAIGLSYWRFATTTLSYSLPIAGVSIGIGFLVRASSIEGWWHVALVVCGMTGSAVICIFFLLVPQQMRHEILRNTKWNAEARPEANPSSRTVLSSLNWTGRHERPSCSVVPEKRESMPLSKGGTS